MKNKSLIYPLIAIAIVLFIINSCKKEELDNRDNWAEIQFNPNKTYGTVADVEGNEYKTIVIGNQTWMAENLRATKYRNGDDIDTTYHPMSDLTGEIEPKYQWPSGNEESLVKIYGRLYTWYAATDSRSICPEGWHVTTQDEWEILENHIGDRSNGGKLKETGNKHWRKDESIAYATNESGFTALPGDSREVFGRFNYPGLSGLWWLATEDSLDTAHYNSLSYFSNNVGVGTGNKKTGFSVRCIKN